MKIEAFKQYIFRLNAKLISFLLINNVNSNARMRRDCINFLTPVNSGL